MIAFSPTQFDWSCQILLQIQTNKWKKCLTNCFSTFLLFSSNAILLSNKDWMYKTVYSTKPLQSYFGKDKGFLPYSWVEKLPLTSYCDE